MRGSSRVCQCTGSESVHAGSGCVGHHRPDAGVVAPRVMSVSVQVIVWPRASWLRGQSTDPRRLSVTVIAGQRRLAGVGDHVGEVDHLAGRLETGTRCGSRRRTPRHTPRCSPTGPTAVPKKWYSGDGVDLGAGGVPGPGQRLAGVGARTGGHLDGAGHGARPDGRVRSGQVARPLVASHTHRAVEGDPAGVDGAVLDGHQLAGLHCGAGGVRRRLWPLTKIFEAQRRDRAAAPRCRCARWTAASAENRAPAASQASASTIEACSPAPAAVVAVHTAVAPGDEGPDRAVGPADPVVPQVEGVQGLATGVGDRVLEVRPGRTCPSSGPGASVGGGAADGHHHRRAQAARRQDGGRGGAKGSGGGRAGQRGGRRWWSWSRRWWWSCARRRWCSGRRRPSAASDPSPAQAVASTSAA